MDGAFIETAVAESYRKNYPDLEIVCDVPYDTEGSAIGVAKGNEELLKAVNEAIADALRMVPWTNSSQMQQSLQQVRHMNNPDRF